MKKRILSTRFAFLINDTTQKNRPLVLFLTVRLIKTHLSLKRQIFQDLKCGFKIFSSLHSLSNHFHKFKQCLRNLERILLY